MGDRANIRITSHIGDRESNVYLYSHHLGEDVIFSVIKGLQSNRVTDDAYLARIIFSDLIHDDLYGETGFGISSEVALSDHPVIHIDIDRKTNQTSVRFETDEGEELTDYVDIPTFLTVFNANRGHIISDFYDATTDGQLYKYMIMNLKLIVL